MKTICSENREEAAENKKKRSLTKVPEKGNKKKRSPAWADEKGNESQILSSAITKSSKNFFTKKTEAAPVRVRNKWTATVVRLNQPMEENILDNFSPSDNSRPTGKQNGTKKEVEISKSNSWITDFEEYFPDLDNFRS